MLILSEGPEAFRPPLLNDKIKDRLWRKAPLKIEKDIFKTPENVKCPSDLFSINLVFAKLKFSIARPLEEKKIPYDRDGFSKEAVEACDEEEEEEDDEEGP